MNRNLELELKEQRMKVDFNSYDLSIKEIVNMVEEGIINIAPEYQRQFRWERNRQSALIESIFLGIPIPTLFMATNADNTWELIDGVQRISSIISFIGNKELREKLGIDKELKLEKLTKLEGFNGLKFSELPMSIQLNFRLSSLKVTTLSDKSDKKVRFDLFERLNRGGITLSDQEIRSCVYRGEFSDFLKKMAENKDFLNCVKLTKSQISDGTKEELVLRFFAFLNNYCYFDHSVVDFLNDYMEEASKRFDYNKGERIFKEVFSELNKALPNGIVKNRNVTPLNLFEGITVGAALALEEKGFINTENINELINSDELKKYVTGSTNSKSKVRGRIEYCKFKFEV
ncbi:DUF262 domain-containing protein [Clostridium perfringens]